MRQLAAGLAVLVQALILWLAAATAAAEEVPAREPDLVLTGTIDRSDHQTYLAVPLTVPDAVDRLVVVFNYDTKEQRTVIDLGVADPGGYRGASGGARRSFTIAATDATPGYLAGPVLPGQWALNLAVPNIREGVTAHWSAELWFLRGAEAQVLPSPMEGRGPGWYRGDLHLHTAHSDGFCASASGRRVSCPLFLSLEAARKRDLDFVAVTEHNSLSHASALRELAPYYDDMLLIPGREMTTFHGHFNIIGVTSHIDFRIAEGMDNSFNTVADRVHELGGIVSVNHPRLPSGEICMGCGWTMPDADLSKADAVEAINGSVAAGGGGPEGPVSGIPFWLETLAAGHGPTAVGGSDNHDPSREGAGAVGLPMTLVEASDLSQPAILDGIRRGRVFIDLGAAPDLFMDFRVSASGGSAAMGGELRADERSEVILQPNVRAPSGSVIDVMSGARRIARVSIDAASHQPPLVLPAGSNGPIWLILRDAADAMLGMSNAVRVTRQ